MANLEQIRADTSAWLREHWDPELTMRQWWRLLADAGYGAPHWPKEWFGLGMGAREAAAVREAFATERLPGPPAGIGISMAGPTILAHGTDDQRARYLPGIVSGESNWCQLFSEPGAGSDLASLRTSARADGDRWVVNGQKVWTSNGHLADMGMLIARTDPKAPKHRGITWFAFEMDQTGVDVRPLREITGRSMFNEVFLEDVTVAGDAVIGELNDGWSVARTTLAAERAALGSGTGVTGSVPGEKGGTLELRAGDIAERLRRPRGTSGTSMALRPKSFALLRELAADRDRLSDPAVRDGLLDHFVHETVADHMHRRFADRRAKRQDTAAAASAEKLMFGLGARQRRDLALDILGADGLLDGADAPGGGMYHEMALFSCAVTIYGGSDEVQRNVLAERVLGLPKDPEPGQVTR